MLKIFLMTKNETEFLEDWIRYHGYLFGLENIHVLDGSNVPSIFDIYGKYEPRGLNVHHSSSGLSGLGAELTQLMHRHKGTDNLLIKVDTDEFLAYTRPILIAPKHYLSRMFQRGYLRTHLKTGGLRKRFYETCMDRRHAHKAIERKNITRLLASLPFTGQTYKASLTAWSIPTLEAKPRPCRSLTRFTPLQFSHLKSFFHSSSFVSVDLGCHAGVSTHTRGVIDTGLTLIHYHSTSVEDSVRRARQALVSHGYIQETDDLNEQRAKLVQLASTGRVDSFHKVDLYLRHLDSLEGGKPIDPAILNRQHPYFRQAGPPVEMTLVRDTLDEIDSLGIYGTRMADPSRSAEPP